MPKIGSCHCSIRRQANCSEWNRTCLILTYNPWLWKFVTS
jgi:hypothetical protein